jgi:hypothetical protein
MLASNAKLESGSTWRTAGAISNRWYYHFKTLEKAWWHWKRHREKLTEKHLRVSEEQRRGLFLICIVGREVRGLSSIYDFCGRMKSTEAGHVDISASAKLLTLFIISA